MIKYIALGVVCMLDSCASSKLNDRRDAFVGLWEESSPTLSAITLRISNGTFRRKCIQKYDWDKPPIKYDSSGHWFENGTTYTFMTNDISVDVWKNVLGKQSSVKILDIKYDSIKYLSTDGVIVEEKRIGSDKVEGFEKARVRDLKKNLKIGDL